MDRFWSVLDILEQSARAWTIPNNTIIDLRTFLAFFSGPRTNFVRFIIFFGCFSSGDVFISLIGIFFGVSHKCSYVCKQSNAICPVLRAHGDPKSAACASCWLLICLSFAAERFPFSSAQGKWRRDVCRPWLTKHFFFFFCCRCFFTFNTVPSYIPLSLHPTSGRWLHRQARRHACARTAGSTLISRRSPHGASD